MSKWLSLSLALVVIAASSTASAQIISRFGRLVAEEQPVPPPPAPEAAAPEPAPQPAAPEAAAPQPAAPEAAAPQPEPMMQESPVIEGGIYGKGAVAYGYPFVDNCCGAAPIYGTNVWGGYFNRRCGTGLWHHRGRCCGLKGCGVCATPTYCPTVQYGCGTSCDPCAPPRRCGLFSRVRGWHGVGGKGAACCDPCDYGFGYGVGYGAGFSGGCSGCGSGTVFKGDAIEAAPKEVQPADAPVIDDKSARWNPYRTRPVVIQASSR